MYLIVVTDKCTQDHPCPSVQVCPTGALTQLGFLAPEVNAHACTRCKKCVRFCPIGAIRLV